MALAACPPPNAPCPPPASRAPARPAPLPLAVPAAPAGGVRVWGGDPLGAGRGVSPLSSCAAFRGCALRGAPGRRAGQGALGIRGVPRLIRRRADWGSGGRSRHRPPQNMSTATSDVAGVCGSGVGGVWGRVCRRASPARRTCCAGGGGTRRGFRARLVCGSCGQCLGHGPQQPGGGASGRAARGRLRSAPPAFRAALRSVLHPKAGVSGRQGRSGVAHLGAGDLTHRFALLDGKTPQAITITHAFPAGNPHS